ncbi:uncharacterized protein LOC113574622 [Electrophorus electricus]|uniref:uncharacterized protein LOC113574622 n=1 Tax=Electrophorus electricus TaxID=8005 RepID=UPI0015D08567|nr:uncharacterized protein LOC113574622 [Electrophorus electricus]
MADVRRVLEVEKISVPAPVGVMGGEVPAEVPQAPREPGSQTMTVADSSVFYSGDEEIPQAALGSSTSMPVECNWPAGLESVSQVRDLGAEESGQSVCGSIGPTEEGHVYHSASVMKDVENSIANNVSHVTSPVTAQAAERESEAAVNISMARSDELLAVQHTMAAAGEAAQLHVEDKKQMEQSLLSYTLTEAPLQPQAEQAGEIPERGESSDAHEQVGDIMLPASASPGDELGVYSVCNGNSVRARLNISFNHLTHEKYGTVSYRQIRRGHTRQRIEEFESRMQL